MSFIKKFCPAIPIFFNETAQKITIFLIILICAVWMLFAVHYMGPAADEAYHARQILSFIKGNYSIHTTMIPGYHAVIAFFMKVFHLDDFESMRMISTFFSCLCILVFYLAMRKIDKEWSFLRTLQFLFFPILFPFFSLLYTDIFATSLFLIAFCLFLEKKNFEAGLVAFLSVLARQSNIVWCLLMYLLIYFRDVGLRWNFIDVGKFLFKNWIFPTGFVAFLIFMLLNNGIALDARWAHPVVFLKSGNIYFSLFVFFVLFLPLNIANFPKIVHLFRGAVKNKSWTPFLYLGFVIFFLLVFPFRNTHPYNHLEFFIRHQILINVAIYWQVRIFYYLIVIYSIFSLVVTPLRQKSYYLIYPISFLYLSSVWCVEQRYYLVPLTLFLLFVRRGSKIIEYATVLYYFILSLIFTSGIVAGQYFM